MSPTRHPLLMLACFALVSARVMAQAPSPPDYPIIESRPEGARLIGVVTNEPGVFRLYAGPAPKSTNTPATAKPDWVTNRVFDHWIPGSLNQLIWAGFITRTNGRTTRIWAERRRTEKWPEKPPVMRWDTKGLMWGMKGLTALSPAWQNEGDPGQVPITALTRRHGYTRGHSLGPAGFRDSFKGKRAWFLTLQNKLVEVRILSEVVRVPDQGSARDYCIVLFDRDLPATIHPLRVAPEVETFRRIGFRIIPYGSPVSRVFYMTEQTGHVSADVPGFRVATGKGGDSGSPNLLPYRGELVFFGGRGCTGPEQGMQEDMDALCRKEGLNPEHYQMQWADLSRFPAY